MAVQIRYRALPLGELFGSLQGGEFLQLIMNNEQGIMNWREKWCEAANELFKLEEDREILLSVGSSLGNSDTAGQTAMLELNRELLAGRLAEASEAAARKGAMYRSVGMLAGLGLAIIVV
jgi:stage III sporulation protein AB